MSPDQLPPPKGPPAPPEPVPFPEQEGPRALPASDIAAVAAVAGTDKPVTEQQVRNLFDFLNGRQPAATQEAPTAGEGVVDASFDYVPSENATAELRSHVRLESDEIQDRLRLMEDAAESGMFKLAGYMVFALTEFQRQHFEKHHKIISLPEAWVMLVEVVNLAMPAQ